MEDNKYVIPKWKSVYFFLFLLPVFFSWGYFASAYSPYYTHPDLTEEIANLWNLKNDNQVREISEDEIQWMRKGAIEEDKPARWINHFYDPVHKTGWSGKHFGTLSQEDGLWQGESMSPMPAIASIDWVINQEYQAAYGRQYGNQTWQKAIRSYIDGDRKVAFTALGHILHLVEDASVPDHTRDDTHADIYGDPGSPYENYSQEYTNLHKLIIANDLGNRDLLKFNTIQSSFEYLASYSNNNFFSEDTISNEDFKLPNLKNLENIIKNIEGENKKVLFDSQRQIPLAFLGGNNTYTIKDTSTILPSYFSSLSSQAVLTGASVLDLFFREVEKYKQDPHSLPEIVPDSYEALSSYLKKSPQLILVNGKDSFDRAEVDIKNYANNTLNFISDSISTIGNTLSSAYDSAKTAISNIVRIDITRNVGDFATNQTASLLDAVTTTPQPIQIQQIQGPTLDAVNAPHAETALVEIPSESAPVPIIKTIQSQALDSTSQPTTQSLVFVGGAMPIVAAPAPVIQTTEQETTTTPPTDTTPDDIISPVITILGENPVTIYTGDHYTDAGATASDEIDGVRTVSVSSNVNTFTAGSYMVTYTATDLAGNIATSTRAVNILDAVMTLSYSDLNENSTADSEEEEVVILSSTSLPAGEYRFNNLVITASSTLTLMGDRTAATTFKGVKITSRNITVDLGSSISADMQGYNQEISGPGAAIYPGGASYGGVGSNNVANSIYGSATHPTELGSSGPSVCCSVNKNGGGAIRLVVAETLANNGTISADGSSPSTSGGSIYVTTNNLAGDGSFHANGGSGSAYHYTGAGSGGRVAIYYQNSSYRGTAEALGGLHYDGWSSSSRVGSGTTGFFDTTNNDFYARAPWQFLASDGPLTFNRIITENGATVSVEDGARVTANELLITGASSLSFGSGSVIAIPSISVDGQSTLTFSGNETFTTNTLSITGTSTVSVARGAPLILSVRDLTLSAGSSINVDGKGHSPTTGPGAPIEYYDGASYGGAGYNNSATSTYGSAFSPVDMGSGGNGHGSYAYGGGAVKLIAIGTLAIDGMISANGGQTSSGGSIYLVAETVTGNGALRAEGGETYWSGQYIGPGGGGRIAIDSSNSSFSGSMSASGTCYSSSGYIMGCSEDGTVVYGASIESFSFSTLSPVVQGTINERAHTIDLSVPYGTDIAAQAPTLLVSRGASVIPVSGGAQDFTNPVVYTVTSATSSMQTYTVTVTVAPAPPDTTPPTIVNYTLNGVEESVTTASTTVAVTLTMTASEDVDWVSIKIENEGEPNNYKIFYSGTDCTDETTTCTKIWDGAVSHGEFTSGTYRVKVRMRDAADNEFLEYLTPHVIIVE